MRKAGYILGLLGLAGTVLGGEVVLRKPPESLSRFYPPISERPVFLEKMHAMSTALSGIRLNINEERWDNALRWAEDFLRTYEEVSRMVPEWKDYFKLGEARKLIDAVRDKDIDGVVERMKAVGRSCSECHADNEISVKIYYRFPDFGKVSVEDPIEWREMDYGEFMRALSSSMKALYVFLSQGDDEGAREAGDAFVQRARAVGESCKKCHTRREEIRAILSEDYERTIERIEELLGKDKLPRDEIKSLVNRAGVSCWVCHNVHLIPARLRSALEGK
ncbi:MAG: hypothetical protein GXO04_02345 [Aquificae bacterium]|nr:hypothetical protein [Aquificota bacterium]